MPGYRERMTAHDPVVVALRTVLPPGAVLDDPDVVGSYARDQAMFAAAGRPRAVAMPRTADEVAAVLRVASEHRVPVVPRGAGSGLTGAANGLDGGIQLVLTGMDRILEIDPDNRLAVVEPGVVDLPTCARRWRRRGCSTRRTRPATTGAPSAATCPPTPAACAA